MGTDYHCADAKFANNPATASGVPQGLAALNVPHQRAAGWSPRSQSTCHQLPSATPPSCAGSQLAGSEFWAAAHHSQPGHLSGTPRFRNAVAPLLGCDGPLSTPFGTSPQQQLGFPAAGQVQNARAAVLGRSPTSAFAVQPTRQPFSPAHIDQSTQLEPHSPVLVCATDSEVVSGMHVDRVNVAATSKGVPKASLHGIFGFSPRSTSKPSGGPWAAALSTFSSLGRKRGCQQSMADSYAFSRSLPSSGITMPQHSPRAPPAHNPASADPAAALQHPDGPVDSPAASNLAAILSNASISSPARAAHNDANATNILTRGTGAPGSQRCEHATAAAPAVPGQGPTLGVRRRSALCDSVHAMDGRDAARHLATGPPPAMCIAGGGCVPQGPRDAPLGPGPQPLPPLGSSSAVKAAVPPVATDACTTCSHTQRIVSGGRSTVSVPAHGDQTGKQPASGYSSIALTPAQTLTRYSSVGALTEFEQSEVLNYPHVYYVGAGACKHHPRPNEVAQNRGFDDERGNYKPTMHDHLAYRFEIMGVLGRGSFGQVLKCYDYKLQAYCAVKIIRNKPRFHNQAKVELKILQHLVQKDPHGAKNVVHIWDHFHFRGHLCIAFELLAHNLYDAMRIRNFRGLELQLVRKYTQQLLRTLTFLKHEGIIHCDLKPENILLRQPDDAALKVIDFGSSCFNSKCIYTYIQSRFYRSPEVILGLKYTSAIDMWSLGCILCELITGKALFPGDNEHHQLLLFMELLGHPPPHMMHGVTGSKASSRVQVDSTGRIKLLADANGYVARPNSRSLAAMMCTTDDLFVDLVSRMLVWDPAERIGPEDALLHPWVAGTAAAVTGGEDAWNMADLWLLEDGVTSQGAGGDTRGATRLPLAEASNVQHGKVTGMRQGPK